ncbi:hypothetical protein IG631_19222 [Alternaria alternata]|nr:hypothetical protein IG631_19222 [Alternaria alternata]
MGKSCAQTHIDAVEPHHWASITLAWPCQWVSKSEDNKPKTVALHLRQTVQLGTRVASGTTRGGTGLRPVSLH